MIESFSVENFLSFRTKQTLSFEASASKDFEEMFCVEVKPGVRLLKLGILYGANVFVTPPKLRERFCFVWKQQGKIGLIIGIYTSH